MAPRTRAKSAKAKRAKDRNPKQMIKCKFCVSAHEDEGHIGASVSYVRPEDTEIKLQDTANSGAANDSAAPLDSIEPIDPPESAEVPSSAVLPECNGTRLPSGQSTEVELEVAEFMVTKDFRSLWVSSAASEDVTVAADTLTMLKTDPNFIAPVQKGARRNLTTRGGRRS